MSITSTKRAYRFREFCETYGVGKDAAYKAIREGKLIAHKRGKATIILFEDAERYVVSLPRLQLGTSNILKPRRATSRVGK